MCVYLFFSKNENREGNQTVCLFELAAVICLEDRCRSCEPERSPPPAAPPPWAPASPLHPLKYKFKINIKKKSKLAQRLTDVWPRRRVTTARSPSDRGRSSGCASWSYGTVGACTRFSDLWMYFRTGRDLRMKYFHFPPVFVWVLMQTCRVQL